MRGVMTDADCLLAAVLAAPGDDAPRLIYADAIEDREPDRAAFIRAQIDRAGADRADSFRVEGRLADRAPHWLRLPVPFRVDEWSGIGGTVTFGESGETRVEFHRGFAVAVAMKMGDFLRHAGELFAAHPVGSVRLFCREPLVGYREYTWAVGSPSRARCNIPARLAGCWPDGEDAGQEYRFRWQAKDALSRACVAFGRKAAGREG